jgi:hypothetical protein
MLSSLLYLTASKVSPEQRALRQVVPSSDRRRTFIMGWIRRLFSFLIPFSSESLDHIHQLEERIRREQLTPRPRKDDWVDEELRLFEYRMRVHTMEEAAALRERELRARERLARIEEKEKGKKA